jgi:hypothetical protein
MFKKKGGRAIRGTIGSCPQVPVILKSGSDPMLWKIKKNIDVIRYNEQNCPYNILNTYTNNNYNN